MIEFIGASIRFFWTSMVRMISGKPKVSFSEFFEFKKERIKNTDKLAADGVIGFIFLAILLIALYFIST